MGLLNRLIDTFSGKDDENYDNDEVENYEDEEEEENYENAPAERQPRHIEGYDSASWILMDYNDVIIHIFSEEDRLFYDLERIWRDGKVIPVSELK